MCRAADIFNRGFSNTEKNEICKSASTITPTQQKHNSSPTDGIKVSEQAVILAQPLRTGLIIPCFERKRKGPSYYVHLVKIKELMMLKHYLFGKLRTVARCRISCVWPQQSFQSDVSQLLLFKTAPRQHVIVTAYQLCTATTSNPPFPLGPAHKNSLIQ